MTEHPLIYSAPMVNATLAGRKKVTRRMSGLSKINQSPDSYELFGLLSSARDSTDCGLWAFGGEGVPNQVIRCPYGIVGDTLWVREKWTGTWLGNGNMHLAYAADGGESEIRPPSEYVLPKAAAKPSNWVTPLFMPRWASRITLEITGVRVERLQEITEADAIAEGIRFHESSKVWGDGLCYSTAKEAFEHLWGSINGAESWVVNPFVWVVEFRKVTLYGLSNPS